MSSRTGLCTILVVASMACRVRFSLLGQNL
jgi:hypothetical protein